MNKRFIVFLFAILFSSQAIVFAQDCPTTDITIESQEDITAFISAYPNCSILTNSLIINQDTSKTAIVTLEEFQDITRINGDLIIQNCHSLRFLDGLFQLGYQGLQSVVIMDNPMLQKCDINAICDAAAQSINLVMIVRNNEAGCASAEEIVSTCVDPSCPDRLPGYRLLDEFNSEFDGHTYFTSVRRHSWLDGQTLASEASPMPGMVYLASIQSAAENEFIRNKVDLDPYIGLNDIAVEEALVWDDNSDVAYENFRNPFENNLENDFGVMSASTGLWYFTDGLTTMRNVVELECEALAPDLALSRLESSAEITGTNQVLPYSVAVHNIGSKTASSADTIFIKTYLSRDREFDENEDFLAGVITTGFLNPRENSRVASTLASITVPENIEGLFYFIAVIDTENIIEERNENNNIIVSKEQTMVFNLTNKCLGGGQTFWTQGQVDSSLDSFNDCTVINGDITFQGFDLEGNPSDDPITNLQILDQITFIEGSLNLVDLSELDNLEGLQNLQKIAGTLHLENTKLSTIQELSNVNILGGLDIQSNDELLSLDGINNVKIIYGEQFIWNNQALTSLYELDSAVDLTGIQKLEVIVNHMLNDCNNQTVCALINQEPATASSFEYNIEDNGPGCLTNMQVEDQCGLRFPVPFEIYLDLNENGLRESNEPNYSDAYLEVLEVDEKFFIGNTAGMGEMELPRGTFTIVFDEEIFSGWRVTNDISMIDRVVTGPGTEPISIGLTPTNPGAPEREDDVFTYIESQKTIFGETIELRVHSKNRGTGISTGQIILELDERVNIISFQNTSPISLGGGKFAFEYDNLLPGQATTRGILINIPTEENIGPNASLEFKSHAISESGMEKILSVYEPPVKSFFEANDKSLYPIRDGNINLIDDFLTYTIRFRNDCPDTIRNLIIRDTLDENLDFENEFRFLGAQTSVEPTLDIKGNRILIITFKDINLLSSAVDFSESQGSVSFLIKAKQDIEDNTRIENRAYLKFDNKIPVVTNTVISNMYEDLPPCQLGTTLRFTKQNEIDEFGVANRDCASISGSIFIDGSDITNLTGFTNIDQLLGDLTILNTSLTDLEGLNNLSVIQGNFEIRGNSNLESLNGLDVLDKLGSNFTIQDNSALTDFSGALSISTVRVNLIIKNNNALINLEGFDNLNTIDESLIIEQNDKLTNLLGLKGLLTIGGSLEIVGNESLDALDGLSKVNNISENFIIKDNTNLKTLIGPNALSNIGQNFEIENNPSLTTLQGIININTISGDFKVSNNAILNNFKGAESLENISKKFIVSNNNSLDNFDGMDALEFIGDNFELIENDSSLTSLEGLNELRSIKGTFIVLGNTKLKNMMGLESLIEIEEGISLFKCSLENLDGLQEVRTLGDLFISPANSLSNLSGLENLEIVNDLRINGNESLLSLDGLGLTTILGDLDIQGSNIRTLGGLNTLGRIQENLKLSGNSDLHDIGSLAQLSILNGDLTIVSSAISNIDSLANIEKFNGKVTIKENSNLSVCGISALCDYIVDNNSAEIEGNGENCSSPEEVTDQCSLLIDNDSDGFTAADDCDDNNPSIFPGADEIANNGIDEDCNGEDLITNSTYQLGDLIIDIYPNPASQYIFIETNISSSLEFELIDISGKTWKKGNSKNNIEQIGISDLKQGLYLLKIYDTASGQFIVDRFSKL